MLSATRLGVVCLLPLLVLVAAETRTLGQEPAPLPRGKGAVVGTVLDSSSANPVVGARVTVVDREEAERTDVDGKFSLVLPPGSYRLRISASFYEGLLLDNVVVTASKTERVSATLTPRGDTGVEVIEVTADMSAATNATQLLKRKLAPTVSDNLGAEMISKSTDSDAAEVVTRIPAVTITDDNFVVVRGLGERYSSAILNGSRLPSTNPNKRVVPLDLFPADFIESLSIIKSYTPDLPADFAGGLVDIRLAEPPPTLAYSIGVSGSANTDTTFQSFNTYDSVSQDWFGFGDDFRSLGGILGDKASDATKGPTTPQMRAYVASLPNNWNIDSTTAPPNFSIDGSVGNSFGPFGFNLAATYGTKHESRHNEVVNGFLRRDLFDQGLGQNLVYDRSIFETELGGIFTSVYRISNNHKVSGRALINRQSTDEVLDGQGIDALEDANRPIFATEQDYKVDQLGFGQLSGRHYFSFLDVDWRASWSPSSQEQPDNKFLTYQLQEGLTDPELIFKQPSTTRNYGSLNEFLQDYYVDLTFPFRTWLPFTDVWKGLEAELKTGIAYSLRDREFDFRRFNTDPGDRVGQIDLSLPPERILIPGNYGRDAALRFRETTRESDSFDASQEIAALYAMVQLPLVRDRLRFIGGARLEYSYITAEGVNIQPVEPFTKHINDLDVLPGVSLIYNPMEQMNVRVAYSQTVSRPEFRELTPTQFPTAPGERTFQGNPDLESASIRNYDLRWDWFFSPLELASASFFYKELSQPIEVVAIAETSNLIDCAINSDDATLYGFELEGRKNFEFLQPYARRVRYLGALASALPDVQLQANVSVVDSEVKIPSDTLCRSTVVVPTNNERALVGQAPLVVNASIEYEHYRWGIFRLLYNTVGSTLQAGGVDIQPENPEVIGLPDIFQERRDQLDFVWIGEFAPFGEPVKFKFAVENILDDDFVETQGNQITNRYFTGQTFSVGMTYSF